MIDCRDDSPGRDSHKFHGIDSRMPDDPPAEASAAIDLHLRSRTGETAVGVGDVGFESLGPPLPDDPAFASLRTSIMRDPLWLREGDHNLMFAARVLAQKLSQAGLEAEAGHVNQAISKGSSESLRNLVYYHYVIDATKRENVVVSTTMSEVFSSKGAHSILQEAGFSEQEIKPISIFLGGFGAVLRKKGILKDDISETELRSVIESAAHFGKRASEIVMSFQRSAGGDIRPRKWEDHKSEYPSAEAFLKEQFGDRLGIDGDMTFDRLRRIDPELADQLTADFVSNPEQLREWLPSKWDRNSARLERELGYVPTDPKERQYAITTMNRGGKPGTRKRRRPNPA